MRSLGKYEFSAAETIDRFETFPTRRATAEKINIHLKYLDYRPPRA